MKYIIILVLLGGVSKMALDAFSSPEPMSNRPMHVTKAPASIDENKLILKELSTYQKDGKDIFDQNCASCHGDNGTGVEGAGPPFINRIYEPNHHGDFAFYSAVKNGVRAHHWPYGNMPRQPQVNEEQVAKIVDYIRKVQKDNGIF